MTVLQQLRNYMNMNSAHTIQRKLAEKLVTANGIKAHPSPENYFAERVQQRDENVETAPRLLSETA